MWVYDSECFRNLLYLPFLFRSNMESNTREKETPIIINIRLFCRKKGNKRGKTEKREGNRMERILQVFKGSVSACSSFSNSFCWKHFCVSALADEMVLTPVSRDMGAVWFLLPCPSRGSEGWHWRSWVGCGRLPNGRGGREHTCGCEWRTDRLERHMDLRAGERASSWKNMQTLTLGVNLLFSQIGMNSEATLGPMLGVILDGLSSCFLIPLGFSEYCSCLFCGWVSRTPFKRRKTVLPFYMREMTCEGTCLQGTLLKVRGIICNHLRPILGSPEAKIWLQWVEQGFLEDVERLFSGAAC